MHASGTAPRRDAVLSFVCLDHLYSLSGSMIFVKWKEGLWGRANIIEIFQKGFTEAVKCSPADQLASVQVFFIDYGITETISIARETQMESG